MAESKGCAKALRRVTRGGEVSTSSPERAGSNMRDWEATMEDYSTRAGRRNTGPRAHIPTSGGDSAARVEVRANGIDGPSLDAAHRGRSYGRSTAIVALTFGVSIDRDRSKSIRIPCFPRHSDRATNPVPSETSLSPDRVSQPSCEAKAKTDATGLLLLSGRTKTNTRLPEAVMEVRG